MQLISASAPVAYIDTAARNIDELPGDRSLGEWCKVRHVGLFWEGPGGLYALDREGVHRTTEASDTETPSDHAPQKALCSLIEGAFEVPFSVKCNRTLVFSEHETRYVDQMTEFLFKSNGGMPFSGPYHRMDWFKPSRALESGEASYQQKPTQLNYSLNVKSGWVVTPENWMVLRCDRSSRYVLSYDPEAPLLVSRYSTFSQFALLPPEHYSTEH